MHLEATTKPHIHNLIHEFWMYMAFTMACPNFKKGLRMIFGPLGVKTMAYSSKINYIIPFFTCKLKYLDEWFSNRWANHHGPSLEVTLSTKLLFPNGYQK